MSSDTWVCFTDKRTRKQVEFGPTPHCPTCQAPMVNLGKKARIPPRWDIVGWAELLERYPHEEAS